MNTAPVQDDARLVSMLPRTIEGWAAEGSDRFFNADTLFDLIDGGAEVYRSLNVQRVLSRTYAKTRAPDIIVDIFDMGSTEDAFGAFHHDVNEGRSIGVGVASEYLGGNLTFWQDRYYVSIVTLHETPTTRRVATRLAKKISKKIPGRGRPPSLVGRLPRARLIESQVHFFHDALLLSHYTLLPDTNRLELSRKTDGVLAHYQPPRSAIPAVPATLLLVQYSRPDTADKIAQRLIARDDRSTDSCSITKNSHKRFNGCCVHKTLLVCVFDAATIKEAKRLLDDVKKD